MRACVVAGLLGRATWPPLGAVATCDQRRRGDDGAHSPGDDGFDAGRGLAGCCCWPGCGLGGLDMAGRGGLGEGEGGCGATRRTRARRGAEPVAGARGRGVFVWASTVVCSVHLSLAEAIIVPWALSPLTPLSIISCSVASFQNKAAYVAAIPLSCGVAMSPGHQPIVRHSQPVPLTQPTSLCCSNASSSSSVATAAVDKDRQVGDDARVGFGGGSWKSPKLREDKLRVNIWLHLPKQRRLCFRVKHPSACALLIHTFPLRRRA